MRLQHASSSLGGTHLTLGPIIAQLFSESSSPSSLTAKLTLFILALRPQEALVLVVWAEVDYCRSRPWFSFSGSRDSCDSFFFFFSGLLLTILSKASWCLRKLGCLKRWPLVVLSFMKLYMLSWVREQYLPDERLVVVVPEVEGEHAVGQFGDAVDDKTLPVGVPSNGQCVFRILTST